MGRLVHQWRWPCAITLSACALLAAAFYTSTTGLFGQPVRNLMHAFSLPGWWIARRLFEIDYREMAEAALPIAICAAIFWTIGVWTFILMRRVIMSMPAPQTAESSPPNLARRRLLVDGGAAIATVGFTGAMAGATLVGPWNLRLARYQVPIADLPAPHDGLRICQISDTHLGERIPAHFIAEAIDRAIALKPDVFLLTGDYAHKDPTVIDEAAQLMAPLVQTGAPVFGVLGNHDWWVNAPAMTRAMRRVGVRMIDNDRAFLSAQRIVTRYPDDRSLCIAGVGDLWEDEADFDTALADVPQSMPRIVLCHNPDASEWSVNQRQKHNGPPMPRCDLIVSGHTHGGQVRFPLIGAPIVPSNYGQKYVGGFVQGPIAPVIVSRGVGMTDLPVRFNVPPEIVEITLRTA